MDLLLGQSAGTAVPVVVDALDPSRDDFVDARQIRNVVGGVCARVEVARASSEASVIDATVIVATVCPFLKEVFFAGIEVEWCQIADQWRDTDQEL